MSKACRLFFLGFWCSGPWCPNILQVPSPWRRPRLAPVAAREKLAAGFSNEIHDEPESPKEGACFRYMMNWNRQMTCRVENNTIYLECLSSTHTHMCVCVRQAKSCLPPLVSLVLLQNDILPAKTACIWILSEPPIQTLWLQTGGGVALPSSPPALFFSPTAAAGP